MARLDGVDDLVVTLECCFFVNGDDVDGRRIGDIGGLEHDDMAVLVLVTAATDGTEGDDEEDGCILCRCVRLYLCCIRGALSSA